MSHDPQNAHSTENKTVISFKNSFWLVVIIVGLFVAALNFIQAESHGEEEGAGSTKEQTEMKTGANAAPEKPATTTEQVKPAEATGKDSAEKEKDTN